MQRIGKKFFTKAKNRLLCYLMSGALALTNLAVMPVVSVSAAESTEQDNGNQESLQPKVVVYNCKDLVKAIDNAEDGDVIGIASNIEIESGIEMLGCDDKQITIIKAFEGAFIRMYLDVNIKVKNIIFDGNSSVYSHDYNPMIQVNGKAEFENVTFQNCCNQWSGGAIVAEGGEVNLIRCYFNNNQAGGGGHIVAHSSARVKVVDSILENGLSTRGGGAAKIEFSYGDKTEIEFIGCKMVGNQASYGGAIANKGSVKITNSVIYGNVAETGADILNYSGSSFEMDSIEELKELYAMDNILPLEWKFDYVDKAYIEGDIDKNNPCAALKLLYKEIPEEKNPDGNSGNGTDTEDSSGNDDKLQNENDGSGKDESKVDADEPEQPKDNNGADGDNPAADNKDNPEDKKDENSTGSDAASDNSGNSNSEQSKPEEDTAANIDSNKGNDDKEDNSTENKDSSSSDSDKKDIEDSNNNTSDVSVGNGNQTSNPSVENPNVGNEGSASDSKPSLSDGSKQPDSTVNNGNQGGTSAGDIGSNSSSNNPNPSNKPTSGNTNNTTNGNVSDNTNSGSDSSTGNSNINTGGNTSQNEGNVASKPENNKDSVSSDEKDSTTITDSSQTSVSDNDDGSSGKTTVTKKKAIKKLTVTAKKGKRKITGKTIKKATIKVKIGKKTYKTKSNTKGEFTVKLKGKAKLKKGQKVKVIVSKKGYKSKSKTIKVK